MTKCFTLIIYHLCIKGVSFGTIDIEDGTLKMEHWRWNIEERNLERTCITINLITDKEKILARWAEHFDSVLNRPSSINEAAIARLPQTDINISLASKISVDEVKKATKKLLNGKAPGTDAIPVEIFKNGGSELTMRLTELFNLMLQQESVPQDFKDVSNPHLQKERKQTMLP